MVSAVSAIVMLSVVVLIGMSQTLADWWSGARSGNVVLDGPIGGVRALRSALEFGWLADGRGVHVTMWCAVAVVLNSVVRRLFEPYLIAVVTGLLVSIGIILEVMQLEWTLRNASVGDIAGNLLGTAAGTLWVIRESARSVGTDPNGR